MSSPAHYITMPTLPSISTDNRDAVRPHPDSHGCDWVELLLLLLVRLCDDIDNNNNYLMILKLSM